MQFPYYFINLDAFQSGYNLFFNEWKKENQNGNIEDYLKELYTYIVDLWSAIMDNYQKFDLKEFADTIKISESNFIRISEYINSEYPEISSNLPENSLSNKDDLKDIIDGKIELPETIITQILVLTISVKFDEVATFASDELLRIQSIKTLYDNSNLNTSSNGVTEPYKEKERGHNVPYKLALLHEMKVIENLNRQFTNKSDIIRLLNFLVGGNYDNVEDYYNSIYGNYSGERQINETHISKAKEYYFK